MTDDQLFDMFAAQTATPQEIAQLSDADLRRQIVELMVMWEIEAAEYGTANEIAARIRQHSNERALRSNDS